VKLAGAWAALLCAAFGLARDRPLPPLERPESKIAPELPARFFDSPRIIASEFDSALAKVPPLIFRLRSTGLEACYQVRFRGDRPERASLTFPGVGGAKISALQLAWDPSTRARYLLFDGGNDATRRAVTLADAGRSRSASVSLGLGEVLVGTEPDAACEPVSASSPIGQSYWKEGDGPNGGTVLSRVKLAEERETVWGWCVAEGYGGASTHGAIRNPDAGARQDWELYSYVPTDGKVIALALLMTKDWRDPRDGRIYRYTQSESGGFIPFDGERPAFHLEAGPAIPRPIDVSVFPEREWPGCASRAAQRGPSD